MYFDTEKKALSVSFPSSYLGIVFLMIFSTLLLPFDKWFLANALPFMHAWLANLTTIWFSNFLHIYYCLDIWLWLINFLFCKNELVSFWQGRSSTAVAPLKGLNGNFQTFLSRENKNIFQSVFLRRVNSKHEVLKQIKEYLDNLVFQMTSFVDFKPSNIMSDASLLFCRLLCPKSPKYGKLKCPYSMSVHTPSIVLWK